MSEKELVVRYNVKRIRDSVMLCDAKWSIGYKCNRKGRSVLLTRGMRERKSYPLMNCLDIRLRNPLDSDRLNSVMHITSPKTLKIRGDK